VLLGLGKGGLEDNEASLGTATVGVVVESTVVEGVVCVFNEGLLESVLREGGGMASSLANDSNATSCFLLDLLDRGGVVARAGANASGGKGREILFWE